MTPNPYQPPFGGDVAAHIEAGRRRRAEANRFYKSIGTRTISECAPRAQIQTAMDAIACGMASQCWLSVAEGVAILQDLEAQLRTK